MARPKSDTNPEQDPADVAAEPAAPRPPQGIVIQFMQTGDPRRDFHKKHRDVPMVDPASLVVDGKNPCLALPIHGSPKKRIRRIPAEHAAYLLSCDDANGATSVYRLATDAEVAQLEAEYAQRRQQDLASREKDLRLAREGK